MEAPGWHTDYSVIDLCGNNRFKYRIKDTITVSMANLYIRFKRGVYREEKSLRLVVMVAKFLEDNKAKMSLKK